MDSQPVRFNFFSRMATINAVCHIYARELGVQPSVTEKSITGCFVVLCVLIRK